ncbi:TPA: hypothetical protein R0E72_004258 [Aeromonas hydrophila subsp. hydrophila]|nr:hypothetical protein [Aeromonas hydrophila subsp. hydrophila]
MGSLAQVRRDIEIRVSQLEIYTWNIKCLRFKHNCSFGLAGFGYVLCYDGLQRPHCWLDKLVLEEQADRSDWKIVPEEQTEALKQLRKGNKRKCGDAANLLI